MDIFNKYAKTFLLNNYSDPLFLINKIRFDYIKNLFCIRNKTFLDIGCGVGLLAEKLSLHGAYVTGIEKSIDLLRIAKRITKGKVFYLNSDIYEFEIIKKYNFIIFMEILEHFKNIDFFFNFVKKIEKKTIIIISSLDKSLFSYLNSIFFAEYVTKKLKKNTHDFSKFVSINDVIKNIKYKNIKIIDIKFFDYNFIFNNSSMSNVKNYNYIIALEI